MANDRNEPNGVRRAHPDDAAQDAQNADVQDQVRRDRDALEQQSRRVEGSVPQETRDRTVGEIVRDAERDADRNR